MPAPPCGNYGDVSGDGDVTVTDAFMVGQYLAGTITLTADQLTRADVDGDGKVTQADADLISEYVIGSITTFPVCSAPPENETRTMSLTEGQHTIQVSFIGYDTLNATINVSATGVTCVLVVGGACGGSSLPRVSTSGWTVTTYLKSGAVTTNRCTWIATKDTSKVVFISEMVLAYSNLMNIGFTPTAAEIGNAVLMYANLGTPASLWGC
jgi:hypothetical protein